MDIWNASLPSEYIETGSTLSISITEEDMCCLGHMAEETLQIVGTNRPVSPTVEANTSIFNRRKDSGYIPAERQHAFKILSYTCVPTLCPPLMRSGSEPALPTFLASEDNKGQEVNEERSSEGSSMCSSPDLYRLLDVSWSGISAAQDVGEEETGRTITFSGAPFDVLWFLEDTNCKRIPRPQDAEVTKSLNMARGVNEIGLQSSERTQDMNSMDSLQDRNTKSENGGGVYFEETSNGPISQKDQPQGAHRLSNSRRGWTGVRKQTSNLFHTF